MECFSYVKRIRGASHPRYTLHPQKLHITQFVKLAILQQLVVCYCQYDGNTAFKPATDEPGCPAVLPSRAIRLSCVTPGQPGRAVWLVCRGTRTGPVQRRISVKIHCNAMLFRCPAGRVGSCVAAPVQPGRAEYVVFSFIVCILHYMTH